MTGRFALVLGLYLAGGTPDARAQTPEPPEQVARQTVEALTRGDWHQMAALMHPAALRQLRDMLQPIIDSPAGEEVRTQLFQGASAAALRAMPDTALFARFIQGVMSQTPGMTEAFRSARVEVLGTVPEGRDTVHVVTRMSFSVEGIHIKDVEVMTFGRSPAGWRGLIKADLTNMIAMLRRAVES